MNSAWTRRGIVMVAATVLLWSGFATAFAAPDGKETKVTASTVVVMDIAYIFKNHKVISEQMKALEQKNLALQQSTAGTQAQLNLLKARMEQTQDNAEKERLEIEFATQTTEFQIASRKSQKEAAEAEAKIYYETYVRLIEETKKYCRIRGVQVVMKFNREPIKADDRRSIMEGLSSNIVFSDAPDISDDILKALDTSAVTAKATRGKEEEKKGR